jgi:hypothetical protein
MQTPKGKTAATDALVGLWAVALTSFVIATLYFARDFLIPLALAALLTFLLSPLVARIERWLGRIAAVLLVGAMIFAAAGASGWVLTRQLVDLATKLPDYKENIQTKLRSIKLPTGGVFSKFSETFEELKKDLPGAKAPTQTVVVPAAEKPKTAVLPPSAAPAAASVQAVETSNGKSHGARAVPHRAATGSAWEGSARGVARYIYAASARRFAPPAHPAHREGAH